MVYTPDEKAKMDRLVECFRDYLQNSVEVDVAYAEKTGYVRLITDAREESIYFPIESYDDMLKMFYFDIICDAVSDQMRRNPKLTNATMDYDIPYRRIRAYLENLGQDRETTLNILDTMIADLKKDDLLP